MKTASDLRRDFDKLGDKLSALTIAADASDAAAVARERRIISALISDADLDRAGALRGDYEHLGNLLRSAAGSGAAALVRERRQLAAVLEMLERPEETTLVDRLAADRAAAGVVRPAARRRKSV